MGASTKVVDTSPKDIRGLRSETANFLSGTPQQNGGSYGGTQWPPKTPVSMAPNPMGMASGGPQPQGGPQVEPNQYGIGSGMERMFAQIPQGPGPQVNYVGNATAPQVQQAGAASGPNVGFGSDIYSQLQQMFQQSQQGVGGGPSQLGGLSMAGVPGVQSVDQLGSATSGFFNNMANQLKPAFNQARQEGMAAATERSGNLTGSGFANALGSAVNRSLGAEQAALAQHAQWGVGQELGRQMGLAQMGSNQNIASFQGQNQRDLQTQALDAQLRQFGSQLGGQGADTLARLGIADQGNQMQLSAGNMNRQQDAYNLFAQLQNQVGMQNQQLQQGAANLTGQLGEQRYGTDAQTASANAQRYMQLLQAMNTQGVGPGQVTQSGGFGNFLGGVLGTVGGAALGPVGAAAGNWAAGKIF